MPERSVLHVLPYPGGGGETYVDTLEAMEGYRFTRLFLAPEPQHSAALVAGVARAYRDALRHDLLHIHGEAAAALCLPLLAARPSVVTLHGLHLVRRLPGARRRAAEFNLSLIERAACRTICVSYAERDELLRAVGARVGAGAVVIHNGIELPPAPNEAERAAVRAEIGLTDSDVIGIWIGTLDERKDPLTAIRAAVEAPVFLLVVGDGPLRSEVERVADHAIRILGPRRDVPSLLSATDFFVLSSRREGLSYSLLEAMAAGLPAVFTAIPENSEAAGDTGIGVPPGDRAAFSAAFRRLAAGSGERAELGCAARDRVALLFRADEMVALTREVYDDVLGERQPRRSPGPRDLR